MAAGRGTPSGHLKLPEKLLPLTNNGLGVNNCFSKGSPAVTEKHIYVHQCGMRFLAGII
jgi:hypothetical protein